MRQYDSLYSSIARMIAWLKDHHQTINVKALEELGKRCSAPILSAPYEATLHTFAADGLITLVEDSDEGLLVKEISDRLEWLYNGEHRMFANTRMPTD